MARGPKWPRRNHQPFSPSDSRAAGASVRIKPASFILVRHWQHSHREDRFRSHYPHSTRHLALGHRLRVGRSGNQHPDPTRYLAPASRHRADQSGSPPPSKSGARTSKPSRTSLTPQEARASRRPSAPPAGVALPMLGESRGKGRRRVRAHSPEKTKTLLSPFARRVSEATSMAARGYSQNEKGGHVGPPYSIPQKSSGRQYRYREGQARSRCPNCSWLRSRRKLHGGQSHTRHLYSTQYQAPAGRHRLDRVCIRSWFAESDRPS